MTDIVAAIDVMMFREKPNIEGYDELLREKLPKGPCDVEEIRAIAKNSPHFRWHKIGKTSDMFRFSSEELISEFWIDLNAKEIPKLGIWIYVKKTEDDYR